ncbi:organic hydroperoxide resistance protein [Aerococcus urinaehominis]|uniref:Organic hydroperoxide resistance protein n=1 Tax=Aerococcus urinaehominis TaxID=128944 RepID=A0A0X8FJQ9_9LACT|nr:Ohr family peroxiredoxin [Aerococcus urinaehominis]AMB98608.1 organic hydroperoxide resistance protein [Aerococcus urinaehominis]SDL95063.1 peroxiredoxin, Ohr subfamily [Aerococcus urinaehominis]
MSNYEKIYATTSLNTGGRQGESALTDGSFKVAIDTPKEMGGQGQGQNPEQLLAMAYSACFNSALQANLAMAKEKAESKVAVQVDMYKKPDAVDFKLGAKIQVAIDGMTADQVQAFAEKAHQTCPFSKAMAGNIDISLEVVDFDSI